MGFFLGLVGLGEHDSAAALVDAEGRLVARATSAMKDKIPAVVHVDGMSRVQTVTKNSNGLYFDLISELKALTGHPVVLNTSFNVNGEPIVNTPDEAIRCFKKTDIDALAMGPFLIEKERAIK